MKYFKPVPQRINQEFGENKNGLYASLGWKGHNGIDFACPSGTTVYWYGSDKGTLIEKDYDEIGGVYCSVLSEEDGKLYRHRFFHLRGVTPEIGQILETGDYLAVSDNTGTGTTGPHLHALDIKEVVKNANGELLTCNRDNGYGGSISPRDKFVNVFVLDRMNNLNAQVSILTKVINLIKDFLNK